MHGAVMRRPAPKPARTPPFSLVNARVVVPGEVHATDVVIRGGSIHRVGAMHAATARRVDCEGDFLLPGFIELHTDNVERHLEPRPGTFWDVDLAVMSHDAELAACGITTAFDAVTLGGDVGPVARQTAHLAAVASLANAQSASLLRVDHQLHLRCELSSPDLERQLTAAAAIRIPRLVSLMDHTPGQGQWHDIKRFRAYYSQRYGLTESQLDALIARRQDSHNRFSAQNRALVLDFVRRHGCILAGHDAATDRDIAELRKVGCTVAEFPTSLEAARGAHAAGMNVVAGAPNLVRGGSHSGNVAAKELARERLIDVLSSDYCPSSLLHGLFTLTRDFEVALPEASRCVTQAPAAAMDLHSRGSIQEGQRADLVRVRPTPRGPVIVAVWCEGRQVA